MSRRNPHHNDPTRRKKLRVERLEDRTLLAGDLELVKDIISLSGGLNVYQPIEFVDVGHEVYFSVNHSAAGKELWRTDGTPAGTFLVKDNAPGASPSSASRHQLTNVGGTLFFRVNDGSSGYELWKSDGTEAGTVRVLDINPGSASSYPDSLINLGGTLYFAATSSIHGRVLWKSDGTAAGTVVVAGISQGASYDPRNLTNIAGTIYFSGSSSTSGNELWKSDGTEAGTVLVKDVNFGSGSSIPRNLVDVGGTLFFTANDGVSGHELWKSDGTAAGTIRVKDIRPGAANSDATNLTNAGGVLFFSANDGLSGQELWRSDGTQGGTFRVRDINPGANSSGLQSLTNVSGQLFFQAITVGSGRGLWKSDGTEAGTTLVRDVYSSGAGGSYPSVLTNVSGVLYFSASDGVSGNELWKSDGAAAGTVPVRTANSQQARLPQTIFTTNLQLFVVARYSNASVDLLTQDLALTGDYDRSNLVDEADYSHWLANFGAVAGPALDADGNNNGEVDAADYTVWRDVVGHFRDDYGDTLATASSVVSAGTLDGNISVSTDVDWFKVNLTQGFEYRVQVNLGSLSGVSLRVIGSDGATQVAADLDGGSAAVVFTPTINGSFSLEVAGFSGSTGDYKLVMTREDHGNSFLQASPIEGPPTSLKGIIDNPTDVDWFSFNTSRVGYEHNVTVTLNTLSSASLRLFGVDGITELGSDADGGSANLNFVPNSSGPYYIAIAGDFGVTGTYAVSLSTPSDDHAEGKTYATNVNVPSTTSASITSTLDKDWFAFAGTAGFRYVFTVTPGTLTGATLRLIGSDGVTELAADVDGDDATLTYTPPTAGQYYLEVASASGLGTYTLNNRRDDHGDTTALATTINVFSTTVGLIDHSADVDWFKFTTTAVGYEHRIEVLLDQLTDSELRLYAADGTTLLASDLTGGPALIDFTPTVAGAYYVQVTGSAGAVGSYSLALTRDDHGESTTLATSLQLPVSRGGRIGKPTDLDWFSFATFPGVLHTLDLSPTTLGSGSLRLLDSDGATVLASDVDGGNASVTFTPTTAGPYYAEVAGFAGATGTYSLAVAREDSDSPGAATQLPAPLPNMPAEQIAGNISSATDQDWFRFNATAGTLYRVGVSSNLLSSVPRLTQMDLRVYDANGTEVLANIQNGFQKSVVNFTTNIDSPYFIKVTGGNSLTGHYLLDVAIDDFGDFRPLSPSTVLPMLPTFTLAPISLNGAINASGDVDVVQFSITEQVPYRFTFSLGTSPGLSVRLYNSFGSVVSSYTVLGSIPYDVVETPLAGLYYLEIYSREFSTSTGTYSFSIIPNDSRATPTPSTAVAVPGATVGTISVPLETDYFRFTAVPGRNLTFTATPGTLTGVNLTLHSSAGRTLGTISSDTDGGTGFLSYTANTAGIYYLSVARNGGPATGTYTLTITDDDDYGGTATSATPFTGTTVTGVITSPTDSDWFSFTAPAGFYYWATISNPKLQVAFGGSTGSSTGVDYFVYTAGTYHVSVSSVAGRTGPYSLTLIQDDHGGAGNLTSLGATGATPVTLPSTATGTLSNSDDHDWFSFPVVAGYNYSVSATRTSGASESTIYVTRNYIASVPASGRFGAATTTLSWTATETGLNYVNIFGSSSAVSYSLTITGGDDHGNSNATSTAIALNSTTASVLNSTTDVDYFSFTAFAGQPLTLSATLGTATGVNLAIRNSSGSNLAIDSNGGAGLINYTPTVSGTYYAVLSFANTTGTYSLSVTAGDEYGGTTATARVVSLPMNLAGAIQSATDSDWFQFTAGSGFQLSLSAALGTLSGAVLAIRDSAGAILTSDADGGAGELLFTPATAGTFYASVSGFNSAQGTYSLSILSQDDHGESTIGATTITLPTLSAGVIGSATDSDWFRFTAEASKLLTLSAAPGTMAGLALRIRNSAGTVVASDLDGGAGALNYTPATAGIYYADVSGFSEAQGTYSLSVFQDDHTSTTSTANVMVVPGTVTGIIQTATDKDWFKINPVNGRQLSISVTAGTITGLSFLLRDYNGSIVAYGGPGVLLYTPQFSTGNPVFGNYYLEVSGLAGAQGTYSLTVATTDDHGNGYGETVLTSPGPATGEISSSTDEDWFQFTVPGDRQVTVAVTPGTISGVTLSLQAINSFTGVSDNNGGAGLVYYSPTFNTTATTYYAIVRGFSGALGTYSLTYSIEDHGHLTTTATPIPFPGVGSGVVNNSQDADWFKFSPIVGRPVNVAVVPGTLGDVMVNIRSLVSPNSTATNVIASDSDGGAGLITFTPTTAGAYFVEVTALSGAALTAGTYTVAVDDHLDTPLTATSVTMPSATSAVITTTADLDWFRFTAAAEIEHRLVVGLGTLPGAVLRVYDSAGTTVIASDLDGGVANVIFTPVVGGTYYAEVTGHSAATGSYSFGLSREDHGNSSGGATAVVVPGVTAGFIESATDADWFRFSATAATQYIVALNLGWLTSGVLRIYDADGTTVLASDVDGGSATLNFTPAATGTYYAEVTGLGEAIGTYTFALTYDDHRNSVNFAIDIIAGLVPTNIDGIINGSSDEDWFSFDAIAGLSYSAILSSGELRLYDTDGTTVLASDIDGGSATLNFSPAVSGTYFAKVTSYNSSIGTYALLISASFASSVSIAIASAAVSAEGAPAEIAPVVEQPQLAWLPTSPERLLERQPAPFVFTTPPANKTLSLLRTSRWDQPSERAQRFAHFAESTVAADKDWRGDTPAEAFDEAFAELTDRLVPLAATRQRSAFK